MSHANYGRACWPAGIVAAVLIVLSCGGCWNPRMVHPYAYGSGRVAKQAQVVLSGQALPGAWAGGTASATLGKGFEVKGAYGYTGEDVLGGGVELTRSMFEAQPHYLSFTAGIDWFNNDEHEFNGHRWYLGPTLSWYPANRSFGLHFPFRAYYMDYHWGTGWDEGSTTEISGASGTKWLFVPGVGMSFERSRLALHLAMTVPTVKWVDEIEIYPYVGVQLSLRLGKIDKPVRPPDEFSSH